MYKVLIVDDELLVRIGLKTMIDWNELGFSVVGEAANAENGYLQYEKLKPDLIFVDIKMPKKNGLWLAETIRKVDSKVKIVMLTCLDDFSYVREALQKGADDYVLKSEIENDELSIIIKDIKKKLDETIDRSNREKVEDKLSIKKSIMGEMINAEFSLDENLYAKFEDININVKNTKNSFFIASIGYNDIERLKKNDAIKRVSTATLNIITTHLEDRGIEFIYKDSLRSFIFFISQSGLNKKELCSIFDLVCTGVKQYFGITLRVIFNMPFNGVDDLKTKHDEIIRKDIVGFYIDRNESSIILADELEFGQINVLNYSEKYNSDLITCIGEGDVDSLNKKLDKINEEFLQHQVNPESVKAFFCNLLVDIIKRYSKFFDDNETNYIYYYNIVMELNHIQDVINVVKQVVLSVNDYVLTQRSGGTKLIVNKAISFIDDNYGNNISLEDVADNLIISKYYLSSVFKKETGINMSFYINKVRIEKAKQLMRTSNAKIKEIYDVVGFSNQQYFSKVFKKISGQTIMEYKEELKRKE